MATKSELIFRIPLYTTMIGMFSPLLASISGYVELEKVLSESILLLVYSMLLLKRKESIKFSYLQIFLYMTLLIVYLYHLFKKERLTRVADVDNRFPYNNIVL